MLWVDADNKIDYKRSKNMIISNPPSGKIKDWWEKQKEETDKLGDDPDGKTS